MCVKLLDVDEGQTVWSWSVTAFWLWRLIWVYTVCAGLPVRIRTISVLIWPNSTPQKSPWICPFIVLMLNARKWPLCNLRITQTLISLRIRASWSGPSLSACRINGYCSLCRRPENIQIRLHWCACSSGHSLFAYGTRALFLRCASYGRRFCEKNRTLVQLNCTFRAYLNSEDPDQTAHSRSLIRAFAVPTFFCCFFFFFFFLFVVFFFFFFLVFFFFFFVFFFAVGTTYTTRYPGCVVGTKLL